MNVEGRHYRTIWTEGEVLRIIDQTALPHEFRIIDLHSTADVCRAIRDMWVRGAGLIGATAAWGVWLAAREAEHLSAEEFPVRMAMSMEALRVTRPTASNLVWALQRQQKALAGLHGAEAVAAAHAEAQAVADEDAEFCRRIGQHGKALIEAVAAKKPGQTVNILTHCNAGWLAFVDHGSALSPIYAAFDAGIPVHVWVDETRPRNQGASLTAWELGQHGVPHSLIADNAGGHLMQHGMVDMVITGADRVTRCGDAANKIGTYLKALAAADSGVPFYIARPARRCARDTHRGTFCRRGARDVRRSAGRRRRGRPYGQRAHLPRDHERPQLGFRRDARAAHHRPHHRTRRVRSLGRGRAGPVPGKEVNLRGERASCLLPFFVIETRLEGEGLPLSL